MLCHGAAHVLPNFPSEMILDKKKQHQTIKPRVDFGEITGFWLLFWEKDEVEEMRTKWKKAAM